MKKILKITLVSCLLFCSFSISAQITYEEYLEAEEIRIQKADSVEVDITNFISSNLNNYVLTPEIIQEIQNELSYVHDDITTTYSQSDINSVLEMAKKQELRNLFFVQNPQSVQYFEVTKTQSNSAITCFNGGFENGILGYGFRNVTVNTAVHMNHGCMVNMNANTLPIQNSANTTAPILPFNPTGINQFQNNASLVSAGLEPFLQGLNIPVNRVNTGNFSLKINPSPSNINNFQLGNVTSVSRNFLVNDPTIEFSFLQMGYVVPNTAHIQPFFRYRIYGQDLNGNFTVVLRNVCIPMNFNNCRYLQVNDPRFGQGNTLAYTPNWVCQQINVADLQGTVIRMEFTVSDCEFRGHFSTVYIDDLCGVVCPPTWGSINLNQININCPTTNFQVCGNLQLPDQATIGTISLQVIDQNGNPVGIPINNPVINGQNFCFTVDPMVFGSNPIGPFSFQVTANLNNSPCIQTLTDVLGVVSFNNCCQLDASVSSPTENVDNLSPFVNLLNPLAVRQLERSNSIIATNLIAIGDNSFQNGVVYHAGNFVELNPGFEAVNGSQFSAYIEGCSGNYTYRNQQLQTEIETSKEEVKINLIRVSKSKGFSIVPNPANNSLKIYTDNTRFNKITITSIDGKLVLDKSISTTESFELDISNYQNGMYIISVKSDDGQIFTQKLIKN